MLDGAKGMVLTVIKFCADTDSLIVWFLSSFLLSFCKLGLDLNLCLTLIVKHFYNCVLESVCYEFIPL